MQTWLVQPGQCLSGAVTVPGDKSISHRAVLLGSIARGTTTVSGFLESEDCRATLRAVRQMGVECRHASDGSLQIEGIGSRGFTPPAAPLDMGNSGTGIRLLAGLLAGQQVEAELTGDASLRSRPMERVAVPLREMGAAIETVGGCAPLHLAGGHALTGIRYELPVASAQIKSAVLLAALGARGKTTVISPAASRDHTERMLETMGVDLAISSDGLQVELAGPAELRAAAIAVPGDLSSAAFFVAGACLGGREPVLVRNVGLNPTREGVLTILRQMGARIEVENRSALGSEPVADLRIYPGELHGIDVPPELVPLAIDELPVIFVAAAAAGGRTRVSGAAELRVKESDRLSAMARALTAVGAQVEETADGIVIEGGRVSGGTIETQGDHRIAMSFAIAGLVSDAPIEIRDTAPVATSFPGFIEVAARAGLAIDVRED